jgi:hypothetical protein
MSEIYAGALGELRAASTAAGGTALTTAAKVIQLPMGTNHIMVTPRNFATAVVAQILLNPWLTILHTENTMTTEPIDYSVALQDPADASTLDISEMATGTEFILMGAHLPYRGVFVDVTGTNGAGTATMGVSYSNSLKGWTAYSITDGTNSTMTLAVDGLVYWTIVNTWVPQRLIDLYPACPIANKAYAVTPLYWTKWTPSVALTDTSITIVNLSAANRSTAYAELLENQPFEERILQGQIGGLGCIEALVNGGTGNLVVNVATRRDGEFS